MKFIGSLLLGIWLILIGLQKTIHLNFRYDDVLLGALAIVAGIFLIINR